MITGEVPHTCLDSNNSLLIPELSLYQTNFVGLPHIRSREDSSTVYRRKLFIQWFISHSGRLSNGKGESTMKKPNGRRAVKGMF
jgi:hypothetical protein